VYLHHQNEVVITPNGDSRTNPHLHHPRWTVDDRWAPCLAYTIRTRADIKGWEVWAGQINLIISNHINNRTITPNPGHRTHTLYRSTHQTLNPSGIHSPFKIYYNLLLDHMDNTRTTTLESLLPLPNSRQRITRHHHNLHIHLSDRRYRCSPLLVLHHHQRGEDSIYIHPSQLVIRAV
jgi:hypothetical protein